MHTEPAAMTEASLDMQCWSGIQAVEVGHWPANGRPGGWRGWMSTGGEAYGCWAVCDFAALHNCLTVIAIGLVFWTASTVDAALAVGT
jgi:hypothetical protein